MPAFTSLTIASRNAFDQDVQGAIGRTLHGLSIDTVQVNIGLKCNLACHHCHVESSPKRTEEMDWDTMELALDAARRTQARIIDITGGAPEMHPHFRRLVRAASEMSLNVMVRTNLTVMLENGFEDLPSFFRENRVHLVASLPCYLRKNVDKQRGPHVHRESMEVLKRLNDVGYGLAEDLRLSLVYNPLGPVLPPSQDELEKTYRHELNTGYGIRFTDLITMTNMPIGRFAHDLARQGQEDDYRQLLKDKFNDKTVDGLMCRHQILVAHDGMVYDCDFNFALGIPAMEATPTHIRDFDPATFVRRRIATGEHCYGCTAGAGSSCGGALA